MDTHFDLGKRFEFFDKWDLNTEIMGGQVHCIIVWMMSQQNYILEQSITYTVFKFLIIKRDYVSFMALDYYTIPNWWDMSDITFVSIDY